MGLQHLDRDGMNPIRDFLLVIELYKKYKRIKPDRIIHYTHKPNIYGTIAAWINGIPSISVITGLGYSFIHKGFANQVARILYKLVGRLTTIMVFENKDDQRLFNDLGLVKSFKTKSIKGCGVDTEFFKPTYNGIDSDETIFTFIGRLLKDKGIVEFVESAKEIKKRYPDTIFQVLGDFDEGNPSTISKEQLLKWIHSGTITYDGFVKDVRPHIAHSDCIVLPSYREGMPRIVLEAMSMGKPVITTDTPGCRETVENGINGFIVKPKSVSSLTNGIKKFLDLSENEIIQMGKEGRAISEQEFNEGKISTDLYNIVMSPYSKENPPI